MELQLFMRDTEQADSWMAKQEVCEEDSISVSSSLQASPLCMRLNMEDISRPYPLYNLNMRTYVPVAHSRS